MAMTDPILVERLVIELKGIEQAFPDPELDRAIVKVNLHVHNPIGSPGTVRRLPPVELVDGDQHAYDPIESEGIPVTLLAEQAIDTTIAFNVPNDRSANDLTLVFAPGTEDENIIVLA